MKHYSFFALLAALLLMGCTQPQEQPYSQQMVEAHGLGDFYCNRHYQTELAQTGWDYVSGLVASAGRCIPKSRSTTTP